MSAIDTFDESIGGTAALSLAKRQTGHVAVSVSTDPVTWWRIWRSSVSKLIAKVRQGLTELG